MHQSQLQQTAFFPFHVIFLDLCLLGISYKLSCFLKKLQNLNKLSAVNFTKCFKVVT